MKKIFMLIIFFCVLMFNTFAGEVIGRRVLGLDDYIKTFSDGRQPNDPNRIRIATSYTRIVEREIHAQIGSLSDNLNGVDTTLEWALASYYSPAVVQIRPAEADALLPASNPRLSGLKLAAAVLYELAELRFLDPQNTAAIGRYEGMIKFIQDRHGLTRAEINDHYRDTVRAEIRGIADAEFNKINFSMSNDAIRKGYNAVLTRTANNQYILEYTGVYQGTSFNEKLPPQTLDALLATMRRDTGNFDQACVNTVSAQARLIPAVALPASVRDDAVNVITDFYMNPNSDTTQAMADYNYDLTRDRNQDRGYAAAEAFARTLATLNRNIADRALGW